MFPAPLNMGENSREGVFKYKTWMQSWEDNSRTSSSLLYFVFLFLQLKSWKIPIPSVSKDMYQMTPKSLLTSIESSNF